MRYLLDTNIVSEPTKLDPHPGVMERIDLYRKQVCIAAPVWNELVFGVRRLPTSKRRQQLESYLRKAVQASMDILPYDAQAAVLHAEERARLSRSGDTPAFVAGQIAAVARVHDLILITRNTSDFSPFAGLKVENWFEH